MLQKLALQKSISLIH